MEKQQFSPLMTSRGLRPVRDNMSVGTVNGWLVSVVWAGKKSISVNVPVAADARKTYAKPLKAALKGIGKPAWGDGYLTVYVETAKLTDIYAEGVIRVIYALRTCGMTPVQSCKVCGGTGCDAAIPAGAAYAPVHRRCLEGKVNEARSKAQLNARNGSYLTGLIGAILGMIVGAIPTVAVIIFAQRIYVWLFALIPLCVYFGYKLLNGKMDYMALVLSILFTAAGVFAVFYFEMFYLLMDFGLSFGEALEGMPELIGDGDIFMAIVSSDDFPMCVIFAALGLFLTWGQISRTSKTDIKDAAGVLNTAIPLENPSPAPQGPSESTN